MGKARYPEDSAGWKGAFDTGRTAAKVITPKRPRLWEQVLTVLANGPATPEQISHAIGRHFTTVRPRISELARLGRVIATDQRGDGALGGQSVVWRLATPHEVAAFEAAKGGDAPGARGLYRGGQRLQRQE